MSTALSRVVAVFVMGLTTSISVHGAVSSEYFNPEDLVDADGKLRQSVRDTLIQLQGLERNSPAKISTIALFRSKIADLNIESARAKLELEKAIRQESDFRSISSLKAAVVRVEKQKQEILDQIKTTVDSEIFPKLKKMDQTKLFDFLKENGFKVDVINLESELETLKKEQETLLGETKHTETVAQKKDAQIKAEKELAQLQEQLRQLQQSPTTDTSSPPAATQPTRTGAQQSLLAKRAGDVLGYVTSLFGGHSGTSANSTDADTNKPVADAAGQEETELQRLIRLKEQEIASLASEITSLEENPGSRMTRANQDKYDQNRERISEIERKIEAAKNNPLDGLDLEKVLTDKTVRDQVKAAIQKAKNDNRFKDNQEAKEALEAIEKTLDSVFSKGDEIASLDQYLEKLRKGIPADNANDEQKANAEQARLQAHAELLNERNRLQAVHTELRKRMSDLSDVVRMAAQLPGSDGTDRDAAEVVDALLDRPENRRHQNFQRRMDRELDRALERAGIDPNCVKGRLSEKDLEGLDEKTRKVFRELDEKTARSLAGLAASIQQLQQRLALNESKDAYLATQLSAQLNAETNWKNAGANDEARRQNLAAQKAQANGLAQQAAFAAQSAELECKQATDALNQAGATAQEQGKEIEPALVQTAKAACDKSAMMAQAAQTAAGKIVEIDAALAWGAAHPENTPGQTRVDPNLAQQTADAMRRIADSAAAAAQGNQNGNNQNANNGGGLTQNGIPPIGTSLSGTLGGGSGRAFSNRNSTRTSDRGSGIRSSRSGRRDYGSQGNSSRRPVGRAQRYR